MSPSERLFGAIGSLFGGRVYPDVAPQGPAMPYAVYRVVYDGDNQTVNGGAYARNTRFQIDVFATSYDEADASAEELRTALYAADFYPHGYSVINEYDDSLNVYRRIVDITIQGERT